MIAFFLYRLHYDIIHIFEKMFVSGDEESSGSFRIPSSIFKFGKQENTLKPKLKKKRKKKKSNRTEQKHCLSLTLFINEWTLPIITRKMSGYHFILFFKSLQ